MKRRSFARLISAAAAARPLQALGQSKVWHIGFLGAGTAAGYAPLVGALKIGLKSRGYQEGTNLLFDARWAEGKYELLPTIVAEFVRDKVDVIITHGTPAALAAERGTTSIPIVMAIIGDPVAAGVVTNIARPDRNITGSSFFAPELVGKRIELLKEAILTLRRASLLINPGNSSMNEVLEKAHKAAHAVGIEVESVPVRSAQEIEAAFSAMHSGSLGGVIVAEDGLLISNAKKIAEFCLQVGLPVIGFRQIAQAGGAMAYGVNIPKTFERAAYFVDRIFKGARPQDLPIEEATNFEFVVNAKALKALNIKLPLTLIARADEVIE